MGRKNLYVIRDKPEATIEHPETWPKTLFISIPLGELTYSRFWQNLHAVHGYGWFVQNGLWSSYRGGMVHQNHNIIVRDCLNIPGWDRLLFLENDHDFPPDMLFKHAHYTQPIVSGLYVQRIVEEPLPVIYKWNEARSECVRPSALEMQKMLAERGLYEVDVVGFGCISIRRDVLEKWPEEMPMFGTPMNPRNSVLMSDDVWFCRKAQDQGYTIWVDTSLRVDHYALHPINDSLFIRWYNQLTKESSNDT